MTDIRTSRRIVFHGLGALGVAAALAGCGGGSSSTPSAGPSDADADADSSAGVPSAGAPGAPEVAEPAEEPAPALEPGGPLVAVSEVPVGGGVVLVDANLVVVQPTEGTFLAYSATCTHTGTQVNEIDGTDIVRPDHGSRFALTDGSVVQGPAARPLGPVAVAVRGDQVVLT